jgi:hypothetical protein
MKALTLALAISTIAFGSSSMYLWQQLQDERARSTQVADTTDHLNEHLTGLASAGAGLAESQRPGVAVVAGSRPPADRAGVVTPVPGVPVAGKAESAQPAAWSGPGPDQSPAFRKMMRSQLRASNKRLYADVGQELGLNEAESDKLIDMLTEQQLEGLDQVHAATDPIEATRQYQQVRREQQAAISDLVGADRAIALQEYQATLPARQDFEMLARQLEDHDLALREDQRERLLAEYIDERRSVPMPEYIDGTDGAEYARQFNAWQDDYNERVSAEAAGILDSDQLRTYNEIQQWQREMREQFAAMTPDGALPVHGGSIARGNVFFTAAAPAVAVTGAVNTAAPAPAPDSSVRAMVPESP